MPLFNLSNLFGGPSRSADPSDYQYPHGSFVESYHTKIPSRVLQKPPRRSLGNQLVNQTDSISRGATVVDYNNHSDSSSLLTEGVLVQDAGEIPSVHRQASEEYLEESYFHDDDYIVPVRSGPEMRSSPQSATSTGSNDQRFPVHDELPPQIIPEYSRPYSESRFEHATDTRYPRDREIHKHERHSSRSRRHHRRTKHEGSSNGSTQGPIILMFENDRGGYDNMWYIMPGNAPVIFEDIHGNEIARVGDFSQTLTRTKPPTMLDQFESPHHRSDVSSFQPDTDMERRSRHRSPEYNRGAPRYRKSKGSSVSSTPSVTFINLHSSMSPQIHHVEPIDPPQSTKPNVIYMDSSGRHRGSTSSKTSSRSANDHSRSYMPYRQTSPVYS